MSIVVLSDHLASQIAAGEVVERPSSVVKELIENSLDARATVINIDVREGGRRLMQVADNGLGIPADELETAFLRHATSKLASAADLASIETLGFRGEALAAIAAVSQVTVASRTAEAETGHRLVLDAGEVRTRQSIGAPEGTVIAVENLFYNVPARLKFLKSITTEKRHIDELITRYALAYPEVRFRLSHDNRVTFQSAGSGDLADVLVAVYGAETVRQLHLIEGPEPAGIENRENVVVSGYVSDPALNWSNRKHITLFVNGRWIRDSRLTYAVIQAYHTLLPGGRFPFGLLFIDMPPEEVDVNVHPTKAEVRFRNEGAMFGVVQRAVRQTVLDTAPVRQLGAWPSSGDSVLGGWADWSDKSSDSAFERQPVETAEQIGLGLRRGISEHGDSEDLEAAESGDRKLPVMRVIGQVGAAYIIAEGPEGLYLIDQHAAHERILYEQFMAGWKEREMPSQGLVAGAAVYLSPSQATLLEDQMSLITDLGFAVEPFGPHGYVIRAVPAILQKAEPAQALVTTLSELEQEKVPLQEELEAMVILRVCKTAAIKAGQTLSRSEMEAMVEQLEDCETPHTCPHGRPTMIHLSAAQLARQFGRR